MNNASITVHKPFKILLDITDNVPLLPTKAYVTILNHNRQSKPLDKHI